MSESLSVDQIDAYENAKIRREQERQAQVAASLNAGRALRFSTYIRVKDASGIRPSVLQYDSRQQLLDEARRIASGLGCEIILVDVDEDFAEAASKVQTGVFIVSIAQDQFAGGARVFELPHGVKPLRARLFG